MRRTQLASIGLMTCRATIMQPVRNKTSSLSIKQSKQRPCAAMFCATMAVLLLAAHAQAHVAGPSAPNELVDQLASFRPVDQDLPIAESFNRTRRQVRGAALRRRGTHKMFTCDASPT